MRGFFPAIHRFFWPIDTAIRARRWELAFWGAIMALAFAPWGTACLAWIALARPLAIILQLSPRAAFRVGYFFSFVFNFMALYWIGYVSPPGMITAVAILSLFSAAVFSLTSAVARRSLPLALILFPIFWTGMEYFRTLGQLSFPWTDLAYTQANYGYMIQSASLFGSHFVSLIVATANSLVAAALLAKFLPERRIACATLASALICINAAYGWIVTPALSEQGVVRVGLLQGNFSVEEKWSPEMKARNFFVYDSLGGSAGDQGAELIIWPETAAPSYVFFDQAYTLAHTQRARAKAPNLIGAMHADMGASPMKYYNAATQVEITGAIAPPYLKRKLVPFAEQAPYQEYLPFLRRDFLESYLSFIKTYDVQWWSDFYPGDSIITFSFATARADSIRYTPLICFEVAYGEYVRECFLRGADFLVTITNDTWFKKSLGPYQHERIAITRAVENRAWIARASNSGFTFIADPFGVVRERLPWYQVGCLVGNLSPIAERPLYTKVGALAGKLCWWILLAGAPIIFIFSRRKKAGK